MENQEQDDLNKHLDNRIKNRITDDNMNNRKTNLELIWSINGLFCTYDEQKMVLKL